MADKTNNNFKLYTGLGFLLAGILITLYGFNRISNVEVASFVEYAIILIGITLIIVGAIQLWNHFRTGRPPKNVHVGTTVMPDKQNYIIDPNLAFLVKCTYAHPAPSTLTPPDTNPPVEGNIYYITNAVLANNQTTPPLTDNQTIYFTLNQTQGSIYIISFNT